MYVRTYVCIFCFFARATAQTTHPIFTHNGSKYAAWCKEVPSEWELFFVFTFWGSFGPKTAKKSFGVGVSQLKSKTARIQWWDLYALDQCLRCENPIGCQLRNTKTTIAVLLWRHTHTHKPRPPNYFISSCSVVLKSKPKYTFLNFAVTFAVFERFE
jgi:hypothetical protein